MKITPLNFCLSLAIMPLIVFGHSEIEKNNELTTNISISKNFEFIKAREKFKTKLIFKRKAPQEYIAFEKFESDNMKVFEYPSGDLNLKGILETSNIENNKKKPILVYLHGGFSLSELDISDTKPFLDKGFIVFAPTYRGENGNEGDFELFMGEVDDAKSAIEWIAKQPFADKDNIYVFGHSIGGGISLQLSFFPDLPVKQLGSCSGLYRPESLINWGAPFDVENSEEYFFRVPLLNLDKLARKHIMYIGSEDDYFLEFLDKKNISNRFPNQKLLMEIKKVKGDHASSLPVAMEAFLAEYYE